MSEVGLGGGSIAAGYETPLQALTSDDNTTAFVTERAAVSPPLDPLLLLTVAALQRSVSPATAVEELLCQAVAAEVDHESLNKKRKMRSAVFPTHNDKAGTGIHCVAWRGGDRPCSS